MPPKNPKLPRGVQLVGPITWVAIWRRWLRDEGRLKKWRQHFRSEGFRSWSAWRQAVVVAPVGLSRRQWNVYEVSDPRVVAEWHGGPFPRWVTGPYRGAQTRTFRWLTSTGRTNEERKKITLRKLPAKIFMFGLIYRGRVVVLDGMHRSVAIAEHLRTKRRINSKITIALAETKKLPKLKSTLV